jgi:glucose-6-phosphate 1-dehydrogenase
MPALYNLHLDKWLLEQFAVIGVDSKEMREDEFRTHLRTGGSGCVGKAEDKVEAGAVHLIRLRRSRDSAVHKELAKRLVDHEKLGYSRQLRLLHGGSSRGD